MWQPDGGLSGLSVAFFELVQLDGTQPFPVRAVVLQGKANPPVKFRVFFSTAERHYNPKRYVRLLGPDSDLLCVQISTTPSCITRVEDQWFGSN
jgi:hypothetical protein